MCEPRRLRTEAGRHFDHQWPGGTRIGREQWHDYIADIEAEAGRAVQDDGLPENPELDAIRERSKRWENATRFGEPRQAEKDRAALMQLVDAQRILLRSGRAVQDDGLPRLRTAIMEGTDSDTGDVWLHREDADILRRLVRAAPPLHDPTGDAHKHDPDACDDCMAMVEESWRD